MKGVTVIEAGNYSFASLKYFAASSGGELYSLTVRQRGILLASEMLNYTKSQIT